MSYYSVLTSVGIVGIVGIAGIAGIDLAGA